MPRRGKNAGLDRAETLAKSERWLAETQELEPPVDGTVADANDVTELDAGMVRDGARLRTLDASSSAAEDRWVWARRVVSARRAIATFEEAMRLGAWGCEPVRSLSGVARMRARVAELRGHMMVFVAEDEAVAAHLARLVRAPAHTEGRAAREHWSHDRLAIERRLDRDFERRAAASRRVLVEGGRAQLARVCAVEAAMGTKPAPAAERIDGLVTELHERIVAMRCVLEPSSARAQRVARLERAMAGWGAERRARTRSPTCPSPNVVSPGAVAILVSELDVLRVTAAEAVLSSATPPTTRALAVELLTSMRHVQIDVGGARYLTAARAVAVAQKGAPPGDPNDPEGLYAWLLRYLEALRIKNYSERTVENRESYLGFFIAWCEARSITRPQEVTKPILDRYQRYLFHLRKPDGKPLTFSAQLQRLTPVRAYFKWLTRSNVLLWNPASELELPRQEKRLPKHVLTAEEAERVLDQPNVLDPIGLRDRAILETLYSTGIRRMEVIHLSVYDLDAERGTLMVRQGKGKRDRMVPIGERAIAWIRKYVDEARGQIAVPPDEGVLFLTQEGEALSPERLTQLVREYVLAAETGKSGSCHLFRHTCATLMLEGGADIRYIQEMLGHVELSTTQIYTQVSIRRLKAVHALTHPSAKIDKPTASTTTPAGDANGARGTPSVVADTKPLLDPHALEALAAVVDGDVRASGAAALRDRGAELMASLAGEDEEG